MRIKTVIDGKEVSGYWNGKYYHSNKGKEYARIYINNVEYHVKKDEFVFVNDKEEGLDGLLNLYFTLYYTQKQGQNKEPDDNNFDDMQIDDAQIDEMPIDDTPY